MNSSSSLPQSLAVVFVGDRSAEPVTHGVLMQPSQAAARGARDQRHHSLSVGYRNITASNYQSWGLRH